MTLTSGLDPHTRLTGPWSAEKTLAFLGETTTPMRLAANGRRGAPLLTPLWFLWADGRLWAASKPESAIVRALATDPMCAFEISVETPPYKGVRGRGVADILPDGLPLLRRLLDRYLGDDMTAFQARLMKASEDERAIRIRPERLTAWDFSGRMGERLSDAGALP